jgi:hypothetical protein
MVLLDGAQKEVKMTVRGTWLAIVTLLCLVGPAAGGQAPPLDPSQVTAFMGTWPLLMTNPAGAQETVRIGDENGVVKASVQAGRFPATSATGIMKDGDMLVLTLTRFENGKPDRAVIALTLDGDTMNLAQMLEFSQTIKRGSGKKADVPAEKKDFEARWRDAQQSVKSGAGQQYFDDVFFKEFNGKHAAHVTECAQRTGEKIMGTLNAAVEVGARGEVLAVLVRPETKASSCFADLVKRDSFSPPPSGHFWIPVTITFTEH